MRRLTPALLIIALFLCLFASCGVRDRANKESPAPPLTQYAITANLLTEEKVLSVETDVTYACPTDDLSAIKLRLYGNAYREGSEIVTADKAAAAYPTGKASYGETALLEVTADGEKVDYDLGMGGTLLTLRLDRKHGKGDLIRLHLSTRVTLANCRHRLGYADGYYFLSDFYPVICPFRDGKYVAREYLPYGDPFLFDAADHTLDLTLPLGYECAASAIAERRERQGITEHLFFTLAKARDFAAVCSKKLRFAEDRSGEIPVRYYYENDAKRSETLARVKTALERCSSLFGAYPYPTYTVVTAPFFEAGVEHSGLAVIASSLSFAERAETILHETAHQWWFGKVGNDGFRDPWMDEGAAEYTVALLYKQEGQNSAYRAKIRAAENAFAIRYALKGADGVRFDLPLSEMADGYYDRVYCGGLLLFVSLEGRIGEDALVAALRRYADEYAGSVAVPDTLISCLSKEAGEDLAPFFSAWLSGGVPIE